MIERRSFFKLMALSVLLLAPSALKSPAYAEDGGHNDGGGGHDDGHDDNGNNGGNNGGQNNNDDAGSHPGADQDEVLRAVRSGRIISLKQALGIVDGRYRGKVIDVKVVAAFGRPQYRIKMRHPDGAIATIRLDARTGAFVGILGF